MPPSKAVIPSIAINEVIGPRLFSHRYISGLDFRAMFGDRGADAVDVVVDVVSLSHEHFVVAFLLGLDYSSGPRVEEEQVV